MEQLFIESVCQYNELSNQETLHPLISVIDFSKIVPKTIAKNKTFRINYGLYCIVLKEVKCGDLHYGRHIYDYQEGTLVFTAPGQVVSFEISKESFQPKGYAIVFHPDLIHGTSLGRHIQDYTFFNYQSNEALHLSKKERKLILDCFKKIKNELEQPVDKHSKRLIISYIELFLNYCIRFYERQFITRDKIHKGTLERFEYLLNLYFQTNKTLTIGLPSVTYFASELNLSVGYFGDLVKKETGKTANEYIQAKLIDEAKERIFDNTKSVSEIAYELGFKYPQHFTRLFKQKVGKSPNLYRNSLN